MATILSTSDVTAHDGPRGHERGVPGRRELERGRGAPGTARRARAPRPAPDRVAGPVGAPDRGGELDPELEARGADDAVEGLDRGHLPAGSRRRRGWSARCRPGPRQGSQRESRTGARTRRSVAAASMTSWYPIGYQAPAGPHPLRRQGDVFPVTPPGGDPTALEPRPDHRPHPQRRPVGSSTAPVPGSGSGPMWSAEASHSRRTSGRWCRPARTSPARGPARRVAPRSRPRARRGTARRWRGWSR